jgi:hypothetical protein
VLHLLQRTISRGILIIMVVIGAAWAAGFLLYMGAVALSIWGTPRL